MFRISSRYVGKITRYGFILSLILLTVSFTPPAGLRGDGEVLHPIYVSVTEINHNPHDKNLEIACKIFTDDLETVLAKATGQKIDLFNPKDTALTGRQIMSYISKHLVLKVDGRAVALTFLGFEREQDAVWSYFEVKNLASAPKSVTITNDLLYDNFKQQINLMHVTVNGKRQSTKLDYPESQVAFSW
jgi:hypothetical protein